MPSKKQLVQLLSAGSLVLPLHYGLYAMNWWTFTNKKTLNKEKQICIPIRLNMRVQLELNKTEFIVHVVSAEDALGFDDENIIQELLSNVLFCPFKITVDKLSILIIELDNKCYIEIFQKKERIAHYSDISPIEVWKKTEILKNYN
ncbi:40244_t:CDS:2, partial [Gigaspora margarita]